MLISSATPLDTASTVSAERYANFIGKCRNCPRNVLALARDLESVLCSLTIIRMLDRHKRLAVIAIMLACGKTLKRVEMVEDLRCEAKRKRLRETRLAFKSIKGILAGISFRSGPVVFATISST